MANVFDVARYILELCKERRELPITTWKLQKLVYYSQAWSLVWDDQPLFEEPIEAWANGPVCPELYMAHRGQFKISLMLLGNSDVLSDDQKETIRVVVDSYAEKSAHYLSELTHQEEPWKNARIGIPPGVRSNQVISQESMAEYYGGLSSGE